jgi:signal transduction histidine kinase
VAVAAAREGAEVRLTVTDAGCGMEAALLARAFEPFHRGGPADGRAVAGSGLGLAICRAFVQANGGRVALASAGAGRGTELSMLLPVPEGEVAGIDDD